MVMYARFYKSTKSPKGAKKEIFTKFKPPKKRSPKGGKKESKRKSVLQTSAGLERERNPKGIKKEEKRKKGAKKEAKRKKKGKSTPKLETQRVRPLWV